MRKAKKKSFDWYGTRQHFSIRKYHFGAASVLLGMSLALGAGGQAVKAEETAASSEAIASTTATSSTQSSTEVVPATTVETAATETVASTTAAAATTTEVAATERTATINYIVQYLLEDGTLVDAVVKTTTVTTTDALAKTTVEVVAELPEGYELAEGQVETTSQEVTEGAENLVTIKVVKKAEVAATTTAAPAATTTTTETATPVATTPVTVEEGKVVLEQNISEAVVLSDEANRLYTAAPEGNESLKTAADATKLSATEATAVLNDSVATLEQVNAQIDAVRTNVEALALELRKFLGTEDIQVLLAATSTNLQNVGDGDGILIETGTTATPDMSDPNGAAVISKVSGSLKATEVADYLTIQYTPVAYFDAVAPVYSPFKENGGQSTAGAYFRTSVKPTNLYGKLLVELVAPDGTVVETKEVEPNTAVEFDYYKTSHGAGYPFVYTYDPDYDSENMFGVIRIQWAYNTMSAVSQKLTRPITNTTVYKTEDGQQLATYTVLTTPDLNTTPSEKREFAGYTYKETTTTTSYVVLVPSEPYVEVTRFATNAVQFKTIVEAVGTDGTIKKTYYVADPNYTGTHSYTDANLDGFLPILETDNMPLGSTNTNLKPFAGLLNSGYEVYWVDASTEKIYPNQEPDKQPTPVRGTLITDAAELDFSKLTTNTQWFHVKFNEKQDGTLAFIRFRPNSVGNPARVTFEYDMRDNTGVVDTGTENGGLGVRPAAWKGMHHTISLNNNAQTVTETTHIYTPVPQEAIIRYQVEGEAGYLEDSGTLTGNPGTDINYSTEATINKYKKLGYVLVSDNFTTEAGQDYDYDSDKLQEFLVVIKPRVVDVPKTAVPGEPVDPTDPDSPKWPATLETTQEVTRTVEYKYEDGTPVLVDAAGNVLPKGSTEGTPFVKTETVTFTRPATFNYVTKKETYGDWVADTTDTLKGNVLPEVPGYSASRTTLEGADAPMTETVNDKTVIATAADINEVVYYTENPKYGDVVVNYVNTDGKVIATPVVDTNDALVGTEYSTNDRVPEKIIEDATGDVYYYKEIKPEDATKETGTVVEGTTEVTYVYEKAGNVIVKYELEDGTPLKDPVKDVENGKPGDKNNPADDYTTTDKIEETITTADGKVYKRVPAKTKGNETGDVEAGETIEVTYIYEEVKGNVVVEYYDTEGNPISGTETENKTTVEDTPNSSVGTAYTTLDKKPAKITAADGTVYYYKEVKADSAAETGDVVEGTTTVKYVYEPAGSVTVNYVTTDGAVIKSPVKDEENAEPGKTYSTEDNKPETVTTADGKTYKLVPAGDYPVGTVAADSNLAAGDAPTGAVEAGVTKEVTYVYQEVKGNVIVNYVDENGNPISGITDAGTETASTVEDTPESSTGTEYNTTDLRPNTITTADGKIYKLVPSAIPANETGKVVEGTTKVTYVYELVQGDVVVHYVDTEGNPIAKDVTDTKVSDTGTAYDTTDHKPEKIVEDTTGDVYYYKEVQAGSNETGKVVEGTTEVTYVYEKAGNVVVNYKLADGTVIKDPVKDEENAKPGKAYSTEDNKPETITTADGKTYKLVPNATVGNENGEVEAGKTTEVTYIYEEVKGSVVVNYIDTEGNEIKAPVTDTPSSSTGTAYDTTDNKPTTITTEDGTTYELVPVLTKGSETGKVVEGETVVTYVYRKVVAPTPDVKTGSVVIRYVEAGNESNVLKDPVLDENAVVTGTKYDTTDEGDKPAEIVKDGVRYVLVPSKTTAVDPNGNPVTETGEVAEGTTVVTYKYQKVANWIPQIPATPENPTPVNPVIPYPFDPTNPDKPIDPTTPYPGGGVPSIPHVPGFTPVDPKTNEPLKPVDPKDPSKGYVPPTPDESGKDTEIPYVQTGNVVVKYVTEDGTPIKKPVQDETDAPAGKSYDTTDNKPNTITTEDGTTYELVRVEGSETGTVVGGKTTEVTYVYRKVETPAKKVVTNHVDEDGNPIAPQEEGTRPNKSIPGYEFTGKTVTDADGNTTHIYRKVETPAKKVVTNHVDEETGLPIAPQEEGTTPNKSIPGYEYVRTVVDADGNTTHIYRKKPTTPATPVVPGEPVTPPVTPVVPGEPVTPPVTPVVPGEPVTPPVTPVVPGEPVAPATPVVPGEPVAPATPVAPAVPAKPAAPATSAKSGAAQLPNTGESSTVAASALGVGMLVAALALAGKRRRNED
ncbi:YSIRK-type signal peptide-containing protein [Streptococcus suis]|nr:YSIRK-type signal peptide-containing protein [Streptococcus suis]